MWRRTPRLIGYLAVGAVVAAAGWAATNFFYGTVVVVTVVVVVAAMAWRGEFLLDPLGPVLLVVLTSATIPALLGHLDATPTMGIEHDDYVRASFALLVFIATAVVVYMLPQRRPGRGPRIPRWADPERLTSRAAWLTWRSLFLAALVALAYVVGQAGGPSTYVDSLASRTDFFSGRSWAIVALVAPSVASLLLVVVSVRSGALRRSVLTAVVLSSAGLLLLTGSRTSLVAYAASLAVVIHRSVRPIRPAALTIGVVLLGVAGSAALGLRTDVAADRELSLSSLTEVYDAIDTDGPVSDFGHMATLAMLMRDELPPARQNGRTYLAATTILLPRAIAPWKLPLAGEVATKELLPVRWDYGTGIQPTAPGEAYLNFGWWGIVLAALVFGVLLRLLRRWSQREESLHVLGYALALPHVALLLRGHFGGEVAFFAIQIFVLLGCLVVTAATTRQPTAARRSFATRPA
jgi:oligosaccharide repeat unit polymerase